MSKKYNAIKNAEQSASSTFLKGAAIMTFSMIAVKIVGFLDKILINHLYAMLGDSAAATGTGLYSNAYEIYVPIFTIATAGFPIAISRLISESMAEKRYNDVRQIHRVSVPFFTIMGAACFFIMFGLSFWYIDLIKSPYALYSMLMLSPAILFGCLTSIYRGYFEGQRNMMPTAISEVIEALSKLVFGLVIAFVIIKIGLANFVVKGNECWLFGLHFEGKDAELEATNTLMSFSVAGAISGIVIGSAACFLFLFLRYKIGGDGIPEEYYKRSVEARTKKETFMRMFKTALPIGLTALVMNIGTTIDAAVIQNVLYQLSFSNRPELAAQYGGMGVDLTKELSDQTFHTTMWGCYAAAVPLMQMVTAITQAFGTTAMPNVTSAWTKGDKAELKSSMDTVLKLTTLFTFPLGLGLVALAGPIMGIVYSASETTSIVGAEVLKVMGFAAIVIACTVPVCSMLQGIGKVHIPLILYVAGLIIKIPVTYLFVSVVSINIQGGSVGTLVSYCCMLLAAVYLLVKYSGVRPDFLNIVVKPLVSAIFSAAAAYFCFSFALIKFSLIVSALLAVAAAVLVYITFLLLLKSFTRNELKFIPKGEKIVILLEKFHLIG